MKFRNKRRPVIAKQRFRTQNSFTFGFVTPQIPLPHSSSSRFFGFSASLSAITVAILLPIVAKGASPLITQSPPLASSLVAGNGTVIVRWNCVGCTEPFQLQYRTLTGTNFQNLGGVTTN